MSFVELLSNYHIIPQFPPGAVRQAESMPKTVAAEDLKGRKDLTDKLIITIDGDDAKDFDDAVSLDVLENGNFCLGVHIADVTHYLTENSPIDRAAFSRGTSVYLIDTVIPMLPFELSNELCSLKPDEIRLTVSVFMEIDRSGKVRNYEICNSYIKSKNRMTYNNVTRILYGDSDLCKRYGHLVTMLKNMEQLAKILNKKRVSEGSIEFETHESKITLDRKGKPINVERYPITLSNNIIEEFMLICNVTVAKHLVEKGLPCVFRVHEKPDLVRLQRLSLILPVLGVDFPYSINMKPKDFQKILNSVEEQDNAEVVSYLLLRAMSKAKYSENNLGHFGLGFETYCHFTSPIRRYSDVVVHRILKESLKGELSEKRKNHFKEVSISASVTASVTEVNAADAEFEWKSVKKAEYMEEKIGERYEGIITHITSSGFFVELPNTVEGFVAARTLEDDVYVLAENGVTMLGMRTKRAFSVGDKVKIKVTAADSERSFVDFEIVGMSVFRTQRRNSKRKSVEQKKNKQLLREITESQRSEKLEKSEKRRKVDSEIMVFENAVVSMIYEIISEKRKFNKSEKRLIGVTLGDMAANISSPISRIAVYDDAEKNLENILISGAANVKNTVHILGDSLGFEVDEKTEKEVADYARQALRHLDRCLGQDRFSYTKRENEYVEILNKKEREK